LIDTGRKKKKVVKKKKLYSGRIKEKKHYPSYPRRNGRRVVSSRLHREKKFLESERDLLKKEDAKGKKGGNAIGKKEVRGFETFLGVLAGRELIPWKISGKFGKDVRKKLGDA